MRIETEPAGSCRKPSWAAEGVIVFAAADMTAAMLVPDEWVAIGVRAGLAAAFVAAAMLKFGAGRSRFGLTAGSLRNGIFASLISALAAAGALAAALCVYLAFRGPLGLPAPPPPADWSNGPELQRVLLSLAVYPLLEETVYRGIMYKPLEDRAGRAGAMIASGLVFQALHAAYGIWLPHYFVGGVILAWAFARSGSLVYPLILHSGWNAFVMLFDFARWHGWIGL